MLQFVKLTYQFQYECGILIITLLKRILELRTGMGHATKIFYIDHMIIQIHIDIVAIQLKSFHLTVSQNILQSIPSPGTVLVAIDYHSGQFVDQAPYYIFSPDCEQEELSDWKVPSNHPCHGYGPRHYHASFYGFIFSIFVDLTIRKNNEIKECFHYFSFIY